MKRAQRVTRDLRDIAAALEAMGIDHLQRNTMQQAADLIESLQMQLIQKTEEAESIRSNWYECGKNYQQKCRDIADLEGVAQQLAESKRRAQTARNELCLKCGRYHEAHNGACDGCRWKESNNA
jgi:hypothetical protein